MEQQRSDAAASCDGDGDAGLRNRYYLGKRMTPAAFQVEQAYLVGRRRLLNRAVHGWGVVQGYDVVLAGGLLEIGAGVALDAAGRELVQGARTLAPHDVHVAEDDRAALHDSGTGRTWLLSAHYAERREVPVAGDPCDCAPGEWDYVRELVAYSLQPLEGDPPQAPPEPGARYCASCPEDAHLGAWGDRGPHHCLVHALEERVDEEAGALCAIGHGLRADLAHGVALACVTLVKEEGCADLAFAELVDTCAVRPLVLGNAMLYDLLRGRDLTRIASVSWRDSHVNRTMHWEEFAALFSESEYGWTGLTITFSGPVRPDSVTADCFVVSATVAESRSGWGTTLRMPLWEPDYDQATYTVRLRVDPDWVRDEILSRMSAIKGGALVEIEVRGDFLVDSCGQAVDGNASGRGLPSGNGTPGGSFLSSFQVVPYGRESAPPPIVISEQPGTTS